MPASTHPSNLQRRIHAGGGRVLEQRKSTGVRIHTTPQVGADGKPAEAPHRRAHGDDYPLELRSSSFQIWNEARTLTAGNQCRADKQASVCSSFSDLPSHRCRIPDSGDAPGRMRPLPFHHQRSPSSSLVNIPQDTSHNPRTRNPCNAHRPQIELCQFPKCPVPQTRVARGHPGSPVRGD